MQHKDTAVGEGLGIQEQQFDMIVAGVLHIQDPEVCVVGWEVRGSIGL